MSPCLQTKTAYELMVFVEDKLRSSTTRPPTNGSTTMGTRRISTSSLPR